ncbi:MAG: DUF1934 domain-containing protein [Bacteroidales bacterium]|nr:DUF1934 domain-containing protein [Bacteroidales bacterium]
MIYPATLHTLLHTTTPDGDTDVIEHRSAAMVALRDNGTWSLRYRDSDNEGQTALSGTDSWMSISRDGLMTSRLLFRVGEQLEAVYQTAHGEFEMTLMPRTIPLWRAKMQGKPSCTMRFIFLSSSLRAIALR